MEKVMHCIEVRVFAGLREGIGLDVVQVPCPDVCTVDEIKRAVSHQHPQVATLVLASRLAVGHTFVDHDACLEFRSLKELNVALIPPVSGG